MKPCPYKGEYRLLRRQLMIEQLDSYLRLYMRRKSISKTIHNGTQELISLYYTGKRSIRVSDHNRKNNSLPDSLINIVLKYSKEDCQYCILNKDITNPLKKKRFSFEELVNILNTYIK